MTIEFKNGVPTFFGQGPTICLRDPLAAFLGAAEGGLMTYSYQDAVKLAGHSCPTVAGSFVAVIRGLKALYSNDMPERGNIEVLMTKGREEGTTGVVASIATLLTGATTEVGFAGMGVAKRFSRRNLLSFNNESDATFILKRKDNQSAVKLTLNLDEVAPWSDEIRELLPRAFNNQLKADEITHFQSLWQERVKRILVDCVNEERLVLVEKLD